jgi:hypothetical protein
MRPYTLEGRCLTVATLAESIRATADSTDDSAILSYAATKDLVFAIADLERIVERFSDIEHIRELRRAIERAANPVREAAE